MKISSLFKEGLQRPSVCSHFRGVFLLSLALLVLKGCSSSRASSSSRLSLCCPFSELMNWFCRQKKRGIFSIPEAKRLCAGWRDLLYIPGRRCKSSFILGMQHPVPSTSCTPAQGRLTDRGYSAFIFYNFYFFFNENAKRVGIPWF